MASRLSQVLAGVDGCPEGWVAVLEERGRRTVAMLTFAELVARASTVVIDVPIGLPDSPRSADREARRMLGERGCCVFSAPYRSMLAAGTFAQACAAREIVVDGKRCSLQAYNLFPKIAEVDAIMTPQLQERVAEGHPEVAFAVLCGKPLPSKKTPEGFRARIAALRPHFPEVEEELARRPPGVGRDDLLDAYVLLWSARRMERGEALRLGNRGERDARGLLAEIVA